MQLQEAIKAVQPLQKEAMEQAKQRWASIAKPLDSLGLLEEAIVQIAGITGSPKVDLSKRAVVVMCADNGVVAEGVTQTGQEVTAIVAENMTTGCTSVCNMAKVAKADIFPVDIGIAKDMGHTNIIQHKIAFGTKNMTKEPAMTREQVVDALEFGLHMVAELKEKGYRILATGEMGIGNTTTSSALTAVFLHLPVETVTGRGAGLSSAGLERKIQAIKTAIRVNQPNPEDPLDVLAKVGGLDIAGLAGVFLGGAVYHLPVLVDGVISAAAALTAIQICPAVQDYVLASHISNEPAGQIMMAALHGKPFLKANMCLGEGTGAVAILPLLDMANAVYTNMSTFEDTNIETYVPLD